jgi:hypothetical protein
MMFSVGQMVVCIDDRWVGAAVYRLVTPVKGIIYTIRSVRNSGDGTVGFLLEEITNQPLDSVLDGLCEPTFDVNCFRPIKETSIEIFRRLVAPIGGEKVGA